MIVSKGATGGAKIRQQAPPSEAMEEVYALWDELDRYPAEETDGALRHLASGLKSLTKAGNIKWIASVRVLRGRQAERDDLKGWRIRASYDLVTEPPHYHKTTSWWFRRDNKANDEVFIGHATRAMVAGMGLEKFQSHRMRDGWIPYREFSQTEHYRIFYTELGITDRIWLSVPVNADAESTFLVDRHGDSPRFSKDDEMLAGTVLRGIRGFHRRLFLDRGLLIGEHEISPVSRRIVQKLLTGMSEKEIAAAINQTPGTTHKYIKSIYSRFGVNGRAGLMALWLGK